uniref:Serpentine receptor class gamma n=1 Tax=Heterorhabditis bacteriophora TaxID=37862 RepID=A0A1I7XGS5_HETBA
MKIGHWWSLMLSLIIQSCYGFPSLVLYAFVVVIIIQDKTKLAGPFYTLSLVSAFVVNYQMSFGNYCVFLNSYFAIRLPSFLHRNEWLADIYLNIPYRIVSVCNFLAFHFAFIQYGMIFLVAANRLNAIALLLPDNMVRLFIKKNF